MKKITMLLVFAGFFTLASAQEVVVTDTEIIEVQDKYSVMTNRFFDNWFVTVGAGAQVLLGSENDIGKFKQRISPALNVSVGKWFTPGLGLRLQYSGLQAKGFTRDGSRDYVHGGLIDNSYYKQKFDYMNLHGDVLFNLNALFGGYNSKRVYEIIPFLGAGFTYNFTSHHYRSFSMNGGIINKFRLCDALDLNLELFAMGVQGKFDGKSVEKRDYDCMLGASLGITYKFKKRTFTRPLPQLLSAAELAAMRQLMNDMAADNLLLQEKVAQLENQPAPEVAEVVVLETNIAPRTIFFDINSSLITPREAMNLKYLAETINSEEGTNYTITGYADSSTGTAVYNQQLSQKRAQAVYDMMVNDFKVDASRLAISADGGVDKFGNPVYLNRVAIIENTPQ